MSKRPMFLVSIVERDKGQKLIKELETINIKVNFQCVGLGTAPTEMMDIFGIGNKDKDVIISIGAEAVVNDMMANFGTTFESHTKYGGLMIIMKTNAANRILTEILSFGNSKISEKGNGSMKNEHHNNLLILSINDGFSDEVMEVARKAGATGGTVMKGRLANFEQFAEFAKGDIDGDREILLILAPQKVSAKIMEDVNAGFGITSPANGIFISVPTEKAYKI